MTYSSVKLLHSGDVCIGRLEPGAHGIHRQMCRPEGTPVLGLLRPGIRRAIGQANAPFNTDRGRIPPSRPCIATHALNGRTSYGIRGTLRKNRATWVARK